MTLHSQVSLEPRYPQSESAMMLAVECFLKEDDIVYW